MRSAFPSASDLPPGFWRWQNINPATEWACKGTGRIVVESDFLDLFEKLRAMFGKAIPISSGYRSPEHNRTVSTTGTNGPHTTGRAVDVRLYGRDALELVELARGLGFTGIGLQQKGAPAARYLHLDDLPDDLGQPRPWVWTY